jgi:hypothetical protein
MGLKNVPARPIFSVCLLLALVLALLTACGDEPTATPTGATASPSAATTAQNNPSGGTVVAPTVIVATTPAFTTAVATTPPTTAAASPAVGQAQNQGQTTLAPGLLSVAPKPSYKAITVNAQLQDQLKTSMLGSNAALGSAQYFTTRDSFDSVIAYYDGALGKNYQRIGTQNIQNLGGQLSNLALPNGVVVGYRRVASAPADGSPANIALVNIGPVTTSFLNQLRSIAPDVAGQITVGDRLILVLYNVPPGLG